MNRKILFSVIIIILGIGFVALYDFGCRKGREANEEQRIKRELAEIMEIIPVNKNPDADSIWDFCNKDIKITNINYYIRTEKNGITVEDYFDIKPKESDYTDSGIIIRTYDSDAFNSLFRHSIFIDYAKNRMCVENDSDFMILLTPIVTGKSWLTKMNLNGEDMDFITEIRRVDLQRSILVNWRSVALDGIIETYYESDKAVEGGHHLVRLNLRWSPQVNCFTEIVVKKLTETKKDTLRESIAIVLKEIVIDTGEK
ncbi:TPA: hypothetical protein DCW38_00215 [candidate division WOR-3 bacterium]|uniref:Uncharacterized protein n=1 Tax=candidate division WOR-3 bacterium TaxID=2052148 RepID=A0A350H7T7_UNCW3|nr:hypothetical protein [candidate division WOR-3 bacterium]